jgi:hypothetical protein
LIHEEFARGAKACRVGQMSMNIEDIETVVHWCLISPHF